MDHDNMPLDSSKENDAVLEFSEDTVELPDESLKDDTVDDKSEEENNETRKSLKRASSDGGNLRKKRRKTSSNVHFTNPLMKLNELKPGLKYSTESQEGPPHNPIFCISVEVNGEKFIGKGNSKRKAKHEAARLALTSFIQFKDMDMTSHMVSGTNDQDFTAGDLNKTSDGISNGSDADNSFKAKKSKGEKMFSDSYKKNPCMILNSIQPGLQYTLEQENVNNPNKRFQMNVSFEGIKYEGFGPNKKSAKAAAARAVLAQKFNVNFNVDPSVLSSELMSDADKEVFNFPRTVADAIGKIVFDKFSEVMSSYSEYAKWKVLAGIVMSQDENMENLQVIAVSTGTKHLNGEYMSMTGSSLNDCHAEIISRRCIKDFFYSQLELHLQSKGDQSIFELADYKFTLKPNFRFHLYISTSPCGDARVFSVHDDDITKLDPHPNRKARGLLRTKIESGEGTIPVKKDDGIQTWDGIIQGQQRYLTMSCSDKVASWNVLGIQGCLLSHFMEPIYLHSIVLGRLFHPTHMRRAIFNRFEDYLKDLPEQYHLNKPKLCSTTNMDSRQLSTSPSFSVNWTVGLDKPEVVTTKTGKTVQNQVSRISKSSLFKRFEGIYTFLHPASKIKDYTYAEVKSLSTDYRTAKNQMISAYSSGGYGVWVAKPSEQDYFTVSG